MVDEQKKAWEKRLGFLEESIERICKRQEDKAKTSGRDFLGWGHFMLSIIQNKHPFDNDVSSDFSDEINVQRTRFSSWGESCPDDVYKVETCLLGLQDKIKGNEGDWPLST